MTTITFLVEVEVERETGLFAGRDEISERFDEALQEAIDNADLSGLGANSDSEYYLEDSSITELQPRSKADRDKLLEYDALVVAAIPGDAKLRSALKDAKAILKSKELEIAQLQSRLEKLSKEQKVGATRIFQEEFVGRHTGKRTYFKDGPYDEIRFQYGADWEETLAVTMSEEGNLEIRNNSFGCQIAVVPTSGNVVQIRRVER